MSSLSGSLNVEIVNQTRVVVPRAPLRRVARRAARILRFPPRTHVQLSFVTDGRMRTLNRRARRIDRSTDVLAFPLHARRDVRRHPRDADGVFHLGDVVVSVDAARRQADARQQPWSREFATLFAHGLLHLAGYDHQGRREARRMARLTAHLQGDRARPRAS